MKSKKNHKLSKMEKYIKRIPSLNNEPVIENFEILKIQLNQLFQRVDNASQYDLDLFYSIFETYKIDFRDYNKIEIHTNPYELREFVLDIIKRVNSSEFDKVYRSIEPKEL
jgi:hypothetical protein